MSISAHQLSVPHKAHDEFEKGMTLIYLKSDYRGAIAQFQLAIKDFPTYYEAYAEEGSAYYQLQEVAPAEEALQKICRAQFRAVRGRHVHPRRDSDRHETLSRKRKRSPARELPWTHPPGAARLNWRAH